MSTARVAVLSALLSGLSAAALPAEVAARFKIVVNAANPTSTLSRDQLARLFLRKTTSWPGGQTAIPIDQPTSAEARHAFTKEVLQQDTDDVVAYWNRVIFSGRGRPPFTKASDAEVMAYVRATPNAVGYVAADAAVTDGIKVLKIQD